MFNFALNNNKNKIFFIFLFSLLIEMISFISFNFEIINYIFFFLILLSFLFISFYDFKLSIYLFLAEVFLNSMGYLFYFENSGFKISLRISLWLLLMAIFLTKLLIDFFKDRKKVLGIFKNLVFGRNLLYLSFFLLFSFAFGLVRNGFSDSFFDFNSWFYFIAILPIFYTIYQLNKEEKEIFWKNLILIFFSISLYTLFKSLLFLFLFSHDLRPIISDLYSWTRVYALGEITNMGNGFYRVFFQNQIFLFLGFCFSFVLFLFEKGKGKKVFLFLISSLFLSVIVLSFSRSFWVGLVLVFLSLLLIVWYKFDFKTSLKTIFYGFLSLVFSVLLIFITVKFPWPKPGGTFNIESLSDRANVTSNESAISSRWALLDSMKNDIQSNFLLGRGFGARIEYISSDPRVLQNSPDGKYSTYAFEWGWLDILLKMGIVGFSVYLWLIFLFSKKTLLSYFDKNNYFYLSIFLSILGLSAVNFFTPYLNHPLGISFLILLILFFDYLNKLQQDTK